MKQHDISSRAGFVAVVGRPNAGKSTLINALVSEKIALVSHKAGATRKRQTVIVMHENAQIVLVDTPGFDDREKELNRFMKTEIVKALEECDLTLYIADISDETKNYELFLQRTPNMPHIVVLTKMDIFTHEERLKKLNSYSAFANRFLAIVPISAKKNDFKPLLNEIAAHLPIHEYYFDPDDLTTATIREVCKEMIREAIFDNFSDELPYAADVIVDSYKSQKTLDRITATIVMEKESQKAIVIGKNGAAIKRVGTAARGKIEAFLQKQIFLQLSVSVLDRWSKDKSQLKKLGYETEAQ
ncbi:GTPase Era [Campylobacterota bacterium]|nr:GTPase Era [Campylobacterota bacterium]